MPNRNTINSYVINGTTAFTFGSGLIISAEQDVRSAANTASTLFISIEQSVLSSAGNLIISVSQDVILTTDVSVTKLEKNGWYPYIYIEGRLIPPSWISGKITITRVENDAAQMSFVIMPPAGAVDIRGLEGSSVICNIKTPTSGNYRAYTGRINIPDIDFNKRMITITCTDNRKELINNTLAGTVANIGYYDPQATKAVDTADELDKRLATTAQTLNFDSYGVVRLSSTFAAASPNFTFYEDDVYWDSGKDPKVVIAPRSKIVNTVYITSALRYQRLHQCVAHYTWTNALENSEYLLTGPTVAKRDMIASAVAGTGWPLYAHITYTDVLAAGFYNVTSGGQTYHVGISWTSQTYATINATSTNINGDTVNVLDSNGNQVVNTLVTSQVDYSKNLCFGASWKLTKKFSQNVEENYDLVVTAPQSVSQFGEVSQTESTVNESLYDSGSWDNSKLYTPSANVTNPVIGTDGISYYWDESSSVANWRNSVYTSLNRAFQTIRKSHRQNRVVFSIPVDPRIDLQHTVLLDTIGHEGSEIYAKGKVYQITHSLDPQSGEGYTTIELALSITSGSQSTTLLNLPSRPSTTAEVYTTVVRLSSHYGLEPRDTWTGLIGNKFTKTQVPGGTNWQRTTYPESFVIDTPTIPEQFTQNYVVYGGQTYYLALIDDDLEVTL